MAQQKCTTRLLPLAVAVTCMLVAPIAGAQEGLATDAALQHFQQSLAAYHASGSGHRRTA